MTDRPLLVADLCFIIIASCRFFFRSASWRLFRSGFCVCQSVAVVACNVMHRRREREKRRRKNVHI